MKESKEKGKKYVNNHTTGLFLFSSRFPDYSWENGKIRKITPNTNIFEHIK